MKIRSKLLLYFLVISLIPMGLMSSLLVTNFSKALEARDIEQLELHTEEKADHLQAFVERYKSIVQLLGETPAIRELSVGDEDRSYSDRAISLQEKKKRLEGLFKAVVQSNPDIDKLRFIDVSGMEIVRINNTHGNIEVVPDRDLQNKAERYFFKAGMQKKPGEIYISPLDLNEDFGVVEKPYKPSIRFIRPVYNQKNQIQGILSINVNAAPFLSKLAESRIGSILLIDQDGQFILNPDSHKEFSSQLKTGYNYFAEVPDMALNLKQQDGKSHLDLEKDEYRIWKKLFYAPGDPQRYWVLISQVQRGDLFQKLLQIQKVGRWLIFVFSALIIILAYVASEGISQPLENLALIARRITQGDFGAKLEDIEEESHDEISLLSQEINRMSSQLSASYRQLAEKLSELAEKNQSMSKTNDAMLSLLEDLSENEKKLVATGKELARSNQELEEFAYVASHDLQEPLRKILAFGEKLQRSVEGRLSLEEGDSLLRMINASQRMKALIEDLLLYSRVNTHAQAYQSVDLGKLLNEVLEDLEARIVQSGGKVEIGEMPVLEADPMQMRQLFQNLISNALKFHKAGQGTRVTVKSSLKDGRSTFLIQDNGIGFDLKYKDKIFQPFQRLHARNEYEGTGIGLAICQKIVLKHRGRIEVESKPGEGTCFIIELPLKQQEENA